MYTLKSLNREVKYFTVPKSCIMVNELTPQESYLLSAISVQPFARSNRAPFRIATGSCVRYLVITALHTVYAGCWFLGEFKHGIKSNCNEALHTRRSYQDAYYQRKPAYVCEKISSLQVVPLNTLKSLDQ